jgi:4-amino-4-deoxy-L-arabinose transferase-like glycosyltransferase
MAEDRGTRGAGARLAGWFWDHRVALLFLALLLAVFAQRDLWSPDEPDFAQCVKEMRLRGAWLLPYLNGQPYSEKPILFYWLMKASAMACDTLTGGLGFTRGVAAWALRLPSVAAAAAFLFGFRAWAARFLRKDVADVAAMILATTPIWFWQAQTIQIDMVFAALLAGSWLCWGGGYLLAAGFREPVRPGEARAWFLAAYLAAAMAFLAKGPLAPVLTGGVVLAFLAWQRDLRALGRMELGKGLALMALVVAPWYLAAALKGGPAYAYQMIVHQNLERALHAWDHQQPFWRYAQYLAGDFFPWCLLLPALLLARGGGLDRPASRFLASGILAPFLLLSCSQSKQGKYILMIYPFLALLLASLLTDARARVRRLGWVLGAGLALPGMALAAVAFLHAGGHRLQADLLPYLGPLRLCAGILLLGALATILRSRSGGRPAASAAALALGLLFLAGGTWGFRLLDARKSYRAWTRQAEPLLEGRRVFYWQTIRSGVMVYTDHLMPELRDPAGLSALGETDRLVAMRRDWDADGPGFGPAQRARFQVLLRVPVGEGEALLLAPTVSGKESR